MTQFIEPFPYEPSDEVEAFLADLFPGAAENVDKRLEPSLGSESQRTAALIEVRVKELFEWYGLPLSVPEGQTISEFNFQNTLKMKNLIESWQEYCLWYQVQSAESQVEEQQLRSEMEERYDAVTVERASLLGPGELHYFAARLSTSLKDKTDVGPGVTIVDTAYMVAQATVTEFLDAEDKVKLRSIIKDAVGPTIFAAAEVYSAEHELTTLEATERVMQQAEIALADDELSQITAALDVIGAARSHEEWLGLARDIQATLMVKQKKVGAVGFAGVVLGNLLESKTERLLQKASRVGVEAGRFEGLLRDFGLGTTNC